MDPEDIKAAIGKAGSSQSEIARAHKCSVTAVWAVIHGHGRSAPIARRISKVTGLPLSKLWPSVYSAPAARDRTARA